MRNLSLSEFVALLATVNGWRISVTDPDFALPVPGKARSCPCANASLCDPIASPLPEKEIFGFGAGNWNVGAGFDWDQITTIAWAPADDELLCTAHAKGVRLIAGVSPPLTDNETEIAAFVLSTVAAVQAGFFDGVTFDFESAVTGFDDPVNSYYVDVINQTTTALKALNQGYQISVCAAWSPFGIDGRYYDYRSLAAVSDWLYVMCYDTRSQVFDRCTASANAPWPTCRRGISDFIQVGVPPSKLVLGLPWYGYSYTCVGDSDSVVTGMDGVDTSVDSDVDFCNIALVPFRDVNCSDAAGSEVTYAGIRGLVTSGQNVTDVRRDRYLNTPYFNVREDDGSIKQYWYDDPTSLEPLYAWASAQGLRGTGPYRFDQLDPENNPKETAAMWAALSAFSHALSSH